VRVSDQSKLTKKESHRRGEIGTSWFFTHAKASLDDSDNFSDLDVFAQEIVEDLEAALEHWYDPAAFWKRGAGRPGIRVVV